MNRFGAALARLREQANVSVRQLAARAGYDHSYVSRLEAGRREPSRQAVTDFVAALGLDDDAAAELYAAAGYLPPARCPGYHVHLVFECGHTAWCQCHLPPAHVEYPGRCWSCRSSQ